MVLASKIIFWKYFCNKENGSDLQFNVDKIVSLLIAAQTLATKLMKEKAEQVKCVKKMDSGLSILNRFI